MPKRKRKIYNRPRKLYDSARISAENILVKKYGLKSKREIWKADFAISKMRKIAKKLISASEEEKQRFIEKQRAIGFDVKTIADILALEKEDYLKRRLQSIVFKKGLARTPNQARQLIVHKHILINNGILNIPSHLTSLEEENNLKLNAEIAARKKLDKEEKNLLNEIKIESKKE